MNIHVSLLEANNNQARFLYTLVQDGVVLFQKEVSFVVGETFSNSFKVNPKHSGFLGIYTHGEPSIYDLEFSDN